MPRRARRVFRGKFFEIYQWRQKLFDGTHKTFEIAKRPDSTIIIPVRADGKIILERQKQPATGWFWCFPGGLVDEGETARAGAARELLEETGFRPKKLVRWMVLPPQFRVLSRAHVFVARGCVKTAPQRTDAGEKIFLRFLTFPQFLRIAERKDFRHAHLTIEVLRARAYPPYYRKLRKIIVG